MTDVILINESLRIHHLPALVVPEDHSLLDADGKARDKDGKPVKVRRWRAPALEPGEKVTVPRWYFDGLRKIRQLAALFNAKSMGIAVGRSSAERAGDGARAREAELERAAREAGQAAERATNEAAKLRAELEAAKAELAKRAEGSADAGKNEPPPGGDASRGPRTSRNG
jgi:hypothetical protein